MGGARAPPLKRGALSRISGTNASSLSCYSCNGIERGGHNVSKQTAQDHIRAVSDRPPGARVSQVVASK